MIDIFITPLLAYFRHFAMLLPYAIISLSLSLLLRRCQLLPLRCLMPILRADDAADTASDATPLLTPRHCRRYAIPGAAIDIFDAIIAWLSLA